MIEHDTEPDLDAAPEQLGELGPEEAAREAFELDLNGCNDWTFEP